MVTIKSKKEVECMKEACKVVAILYDKLEKENYSTVIEMKSNGIIKINDSELRITKNKNKIQWKKLYFEV